MSKKPVYGDGQNFGGPDPLSSVLVQGNSGFNNENSLMNALVSCNLKNLIPHQKKSIFSMETIKLIFYSRNLLIM